MGQLFKKTLILNNIKRRRQVYGIVKIHKDSTVKLFFDLKDISISKDLTAAVISSNMPIQFIQFTTNKFDIALECETEIENIVVIILDKANLPLAVSECEEFLLLGYLDTIKNLKKQSKDNFSFISKFNDNEPIEIVPKKEPLNESIQILKDILEEPKKHLTVDADISSFQTDNNAKFEKNDNSEQNKLNDNAVVFQTDNKFEEMDNCPQNNLDTVNTAFPGGDIKFEATANTLESNNENGYIDDDILLREDSTLGDELTIADENYYEKALHNVKPVKQFYESIKSELDEIFNKHERETVLEKLIPQSKFCKIMYEENKYYIVGLIFENNVPQFICYGVPSFNPDTPPKELKGFSGYIPTNPDNLTELGYWIMYQDTETGETVYPKDE